MKKLVLTCEHGGAKIPKKYQPLFRKKSSVLKTHRALDIGALQVAFDLGRLLKTSLDYSVVSRLIVDLNRLLESPTLFSEFTASLSNSEKSEILKKYYDPHWKKVIRRVSGLISRRHQVFHVAIHSMTDKLHGKTRQMQLALLYDPQKKQEKHFANLWIQELRQEFPNYKIARNNPYIGNGGGLTCHFRQDFDEKKYLGIEIEMNQKLLQSMKTKDRKLFSQKLAASLDRAISKY